MLKRLAIAVAILGLAAAAVGPRLTVRRARRLSKRIEINAPADKVWAVVGNFQDMSWLPVVAKTEGTGGNDVNATRKLTLKSGGTIDEKLDKYDADEHTYGYEITKVDVKVLPVNDYSSHITRDGQRRQIDGRMEGRVLSRLRAERPAAGTQSTKRRSRPLRAFIKEASPH